MVRTQRAAGPDRDEDAQATVEMAIVIPVVVTLLLAVVQAGMVIADRLAVIDAARVGARAAALSPSEDAVRRAYGDHGIDLAGGTMRLSGELRPGGLAVIEVGRPPTRLPIVGRALGSMVISERLAFRVEDPGRPGP